MGAWLENAAGPSLSLAWVYLELVLALTLLTTFLHFRSLRKTREELAAVRLYFLSFFGLLLAAPCLIVVLAASDPLSVLASWGWTFGRVDRGLAFLAAGLPLAVLSGFVGARDPAMKIMYPFAKAACSGTRRFVGYEISYLLFYYLPWEFVFRGVLFLPLVPAVGLIPALTLQTVISTLLHIGHPDTEVFAAAGAGFLFGAVAFLTGSFLYTFILHAAVGMATDTFICRQRIKEQP